MAAATGTIVTEFSPPGNVSDLNADQKKQWSNVVSYWMDREVNAGRPQFINPSSTQKASDYAEKEISWIGFPRQVKINTPSDEKRWEVADRSRHYQDEYLEWSVKRDNTGKINQVTFTCEGPEYWHVLGVLAKDVVLNLYRQHIDQNVQTSDLFDAEGKYIPENKWNKDTANGAMHLIQRNNTLSAEINLAAGASMVRQKEGRILTGQKELILCGRYGAPERNSDPKIGADVNALTRQGAVVSLKDPVGLYIQKFDPIGWQTPDNSDPKDYWSITRGDSQSAVRAVYQVPQDKSFSVGDIKINGTPINFGSQIADFVHVKLTGIAQSFGGEVSKFDCSDNPIPSGEIGGAALLAPIQPLGSLPGPVADDALMGIMKTSSNRSTSTPIDY